MLKLERKRRINKGNPIRIANFLKDFKLKLIIRLFLKTDITDPKFHLLINVISLRIVFSLYQRVNGNFVAIFPNLLDKNDVKSNYGIKDLEIY
ncbi:hypothetical protein BES34_008370 [Leptospira inadai serovar Lyme]|uniref:Uncharacterized protein n=1 Tax=Leptospira inadai serovar Lyme TaxID=293084 RepID=A0ABX4YJF3_9LEPT|nr:hypothetical protein BES34_008370 [Leptospira inadai serovar Lyme]